MRKKWNVPKSVALVHWDAGVVAERAERLRDSGYEVVHLVHRGGPDLRRLAKNPPDAFVIDLGRLPSQGRDLGLWLRRRKATRGVPIVFVGGEPAKVAGVRKLLPDAVYTEWKRIRGNLKRALRAPPEEPVVRETMAGYSGTPLPKKLGIKADRGVVLLGAPAGFEQTLGKLPENVRIRRQARGRSDIVLLFSKSKADLARRFPAAARALAEGGGLWIVWPKKASGMASDLTQTEVRAFGLARNFVDYKICAVDATWSGLLFARRRKKSV